MGLRQKEQKWDGSRCVFFDFARVGMFVFFIPYLLSVVQNVNGPQSSRLQYWLSLGLPLFIFFSFFDE